MPVRLWVIGSELVDTPEALTVIDLAIREVFAPAVRGNGEQVDVAVADAWAEPTPLGTYGCW